MMVPGSLPDVRRDGGGEEGIEVRRHVDAVRRNALVITAIVALVTGAVFAVSSSLPPTYQAEAKIVFEESAGGFGQSDANAIERRLSTSRELLTSRRVLDAAGRRLVGLDGSSLRGKVTSSVDAEASIIAVVAVDESPNRAAAIANTVADVFLDQRKQLIESRISAARETMRQQIESLSARADSGPEVTALRQRLSELGVAESLAGTDLQLAERAEVPSAAASPRPLRNAVIALFASLFLGILFALARDQFNPRFNSPRELSRILDLPVLVGVPYVGRRGRRRKARILRTVEDESYQTLGATLKFTAEAKDDQVILITGALPAEGKTTVSASLGRALARTGHKTLLLSADLRMPKLQDQFGLDLDCGLADILAQIEEGASGGDTLARATNVVVAAKPGTSRFGCLHVITSGKAADDPGRLVSAPAMCTLLERLRTMAYDYILIDAPPLLGFADAQVLSQWSDAMLIVSRLDRIDPEHATELREVLDRLENRALGLVVIGARSGVSPYYLAKDLEPASAPA